MVETAGTALRVALVADAGEQREHLRDLLKTHALEVVFESSLTGLGEVALDGADADVILIDLVEEPDIQSLEQLIEAAPVPILFSESGLATGSRWGEKLVRKLVALARAGEPSAAPAPEPPPAQPRPALKVVGNEEIDPERPVASRLCVLGASIGGPDALKQFLAALPAEIGTAFLLAQHIGAGFDRRLTEQLNRVSALEVRLACEGDIPRHGVVLVVPTGGRVELDADCRVRLTAEPWSGPYNPTINDVMASAAERFGNRSGGILFSGMGDDGADGAVAIADAGGYVWAQDEASCVISSIPDSARRRGVVGYSGTPVKLAERLQGVCGERLSATEPGYVGA